MPTVFRHGPYRFHFYSVDRGEPMHIHVERDDAECKYWIQPLHLASVRGFGRKELARIEKLVASHHKQIVEKWNEHFNH